jgi:hypothetical protein
MSDGVRYTEGSGPKIATRKVQYSGEDMQVQAAGLVTFSGDDDAKLATDVGQDNPLPVAELVLALTGAVAQTAIVNNILESVAGAAGTEVDRFRSGSVQVISTGTAGTFIFEQSNDGINWAVLPVWNAASAVGASIAAAITATVSSIIYSFAVRARFIRLRIVTPITGGSIQAISRLTTEAYSPLSISAFLGVSASRIGFIAAAGIWYDDTSTALAANVNFIGTSRDATVTTTGAAIVSGASHAKEVRACAESDVAGTLWLEVSRDNVTWRRIRSVATDVVAGGGQVAELSYLPAWRFWRIGFTNGAAAQSRFTLGTLAMAA